MNVWERSGGIVFVHLQVHSGYSLLNSAASVKELVTQAKELGYSSLALTDENVMYGAIEFYKACKSNGIKPIIGLTASIYTDDTELEAHPLILLAETNIGYQNLVKISSALQSMAKGGMKRKWMKSYHEGLIAITPGENGYIESLLKAGKFEEAVRAAEGFRELFGEGRFYLGTSRLKDVRRYQKRFSACQPRRKLLSALRGCPLYQERRSRCVPLSVRY